MSSKVPAHVPLSKICAKCGRDVSNQKRTKDKQGHYYCESCVKRLTERSEGDDATAAHGAPSARDQSELLFCEKCGGQFAQHFLHIYRDGRVLCRTCSTRCGSVLGFSESTLGLLVGIPGILLLGFPWLFFVLLSAFCNDLAGGAAFLVTVIVGGRLAFVGRGFAANSGSRAAQLTLRWLIFGIMAIYVAGLASAFGQDIYDEGQARSLTYWLQSIFGLVIWIVIGLIFAKLRPRANIRYQFKLFSLANIVFTSLAAIGLVGLIAALSLPAHPRMPLQKAATEGNLVEVDANLFLGKKDIVNEKNSYGFTPLDAAAAGGWVDAAKRLLDNGADINGGSASRTPLHLAVDANHAEVVELLLARGANTKDGVSSPLHIAAEKGYRQIAQMLIKSGANVNAGAGSYQGTPLLVACNNGKAALVQFLLDKSADIQAVDGEKRTALHLAAQRGDMETVQLLLQRGASVNTQDKSGHTPLQSAMKYHQAEVAKLFLSGSAASATSEITIAPEQPRGVGGTVRPTPESNISYRANVRVPSAEIASPSTIPSASSPLTDAKCEIWSREFEQATAKGDMTFLTRNLDSEGLARRAVAGIVISDELMPKVQDFVNEFVKQTGDLSDQVVKSRPCKVLWTRKESGEHLAMVRCLLKSDDVYYLRLNLAPNAAGDVRIVDLFELSSGGEWSRMIRTIALPLVISSDPVALHSLKLADIEILNNAALLGEIYQKNDPKQLAEIPNLVRQLPPSLQNDRFLSLLNVKGTALLGDAVFNAAVQRHQKLFPGDPSLSYVTFQRHVRSKDYAKMLDALFTLEQAVGADPYLVGLKSVAYAGISNMSQARLLAQQAVAKEPTLIAPNWVLLQIALDEKNYREVAGSLTILEDLGQSLPDLRADTAFVAFVASPEYRTWSANRKAGKPDGPEKAVRDNGIAASALTQLGNAADEYNKINGQYSALCSDYRLKWTASAERASLFADQKAKDDAYQEAWKTGSRTTQAEKEAARQALLDAGSALAKAEKEAVERRPDCKALNTKRRAAFRAWKAGAAAYQDQCRRAGQSADLPREIDPAKIWWFGSEDRDE